MSISNLERRVLVITHFPSPYQVELFNEVERLRPSALKVLYLFRRAPKRSWKGVTVTHQHAYLDEGTVSVSMASEVQQADFVVFNYYNDARASQLIRARAATGRPWCFWGERPGYRFPWLARVARLGRLAALRGSEQAIWGIGSWAVDAYRQEFGALARVPEPAVLFESRSLSGRASDILQRAFYVPVFRCPLASQGRRPPGPRVRQAGRRIIHTCGSR